MIPLHIYLLLALLGGVHVALIAAVVRLYFQISHIRSETLYIRKNFLSTVVATRENTVRFIELARFFQTFQITLPEEATNVSKI